MPTVFFGPFVGEFGWELAHWQWWVRRMCLEDFKDHRKIACSFPGRAAFYPYIDEFWPLPEDFLGSGFIPWGYATAGWRHGLPGIYTERHARIRVPEQWFKWPLPFRYGPSAIQYIFRPQKVNEIKLKTPDVEPQAGQLLAALKKRLPEDTQFFVPWQVNEYKPQDLTFGLEVAAAPRGLSDFRTRPIPIEAQRLEILRATPSGKEAFKRIFPGNAQLIGVFPRRIAVRRSDRNWPKGRYLQLIQLLQNKFPENKVAIFGEPGGAYFAGEIPEGCISLIDVPVEMRLDLQLAALENCVFVLGAASGGISMAMAAGCPVLCWGYEYNVDMIHRYNLFNVPLVFYPKMQPSVGEAIRLAQSFYWALKHNYFH
jgi:hypothetical protein